jgi:acetyl-CoA synthetase
LKEKVDRAVESAHTVERVVVLRYKGGALPAGPRDLDWHDLLRPCPADFAAPAFDSETRSFILYTSGTTGRPKGTVHTHAGALAQMAKEIWLAFDHKPEDRFFWLSDIGWMMGPWTILGNHNFGGTIFLYDGAPDFPNPERLWHMIERHGITTFGISPTAVRLLMRSGGRFDPLPSLRLLGSTGEPWDDTSYRWFFEHAGGSRCPIINISGGTEIVGCFLFPLPIQPRKPSSLGGPAPGMAADVVDEHGNPVRDGRTGFLVCRKPAPSMTRGVWNDPERYVSSYWSRIPGMWFHGDWASIDADGCWFLHGRADESMNVAGRKVGPAEVEEALIEHPAVAEAAVVGLPHDLKGESIAAFVVLHGGAELTEALRREISDVVARSLGAAFRPDLLERVAELPKTQSGKIVRRLIRQTCLGEEPGDVSTVVNPSVLQQFRRA